MEITTGTVDDVDAVVDQWVSLARGQREYDSHIAPERNRATVREATLRRIVADELLVAREDGELAGFVMFTVESGQYEQDVQRGVVQNLYVAPPYRRQGIGTRLLAATEERFADSGVDRVALNVMAANEDARRFYRRHGYEPHRVELEKPVESDTL
ncbi:Acetyltransferase, GNAT family [Halomicrobium zhouii]|uniref:Acetyltransferase, GNAT family n=1 Tax=Halomicrobium zhouii TaxID=767519 RepID=A0A1I6LQM6_9EURY|nr:GNAT family N-acetyltransferase [Halomicrobium zhouii]SFS05807.1 Acetyltransferase, GNAT family [Halomicrobium zhouii]